MNYERWDEPTEYKAYYAVCTDPKCYWEDSYHGEPEDCKNECPVCGSDTDIQQDWDNR